MRWKIRLEMFIISKSKIALQIVLNCQNKEKLKNKIELLFDI